MLTHEIGIDANDAEDYKISGWSEPITVTIPRTQETQKPLLLQWLQFFFEKHPNVLPILQQLLGL